MNSLDSRRDEGAGFIQGRLPWLFSVKSPFSVVRAAIDMAIVDIVRAVNNHNDAGASDATLSVVSEHIREQLENGLTLYYTPPPSKNREADSSDPIDLLSEPDTAETPAEYFESSFWALFRLAKFFAEKAAASDSDTRHTRIDPNKLLAIVGAESDRKSHAFFWVADFPSPEVLIFSALVDRKNKLSKRFESGLTQEAIDGMDGLVNSGIPLSTYEAPTMLGAASWGQIEAAYKDIVHLRDAMLEQASKRIPGLNGICGLG